METSEFIRIFLPSFILSHFDAIKMIDTLYQYYLDEKHILSPNSLSHPVISYGFTNIA